MGSVQVDQLLPDGSVVLDVDRRLSNAEKLSLLLQWLPGAEPGRVDGQPYVRFEDQALLYRQVTHLGGLWGAYKKRIQIPQTWLKAHGALTQLGLQPRFIGIYNYKSVTIFVDFDPSTYLRRKANQSAAHVWTNDLFQAMQLGSFEKIDRNGNKLRSVSAADLASHLRGGKTATPLDPFLAVFESFNRFIFTGCPVTVNDAVQEMHRAGWPHTFQTEWAGFYLEYLLDAHLRAQPGSTPVALVQQKRVGELDFDLVFRSSGQVVFLGDLKASSESTTEAPGNDAANLERALARYGRFWYVIYEHSTVKARDLGDVATLAWNSWKQDVGYFARAGKAFNPMSYANKLKAEVTFTRMMILEVNQANRDLILGDFRQGRQTSGAARAVKGLIKKSAIDNFKIYSHAGIL